MKKVKKAGTQSDADPFVFVMSSSVRDGHGDIVEQDWNLSDFEKNPIALWGHSSDAPIGRWEDVRVVGEKLIGRLVMAAKGTSQRIDELRSLVEQRILKAVSVGFVPGEADEVEKGKPWRGLRLRNNTLKETSLVAVGANPEALSLAKRLTQADRQILFGKTADTWDISAARQLGYSPPSRVSDSKRTFSLSNRKGDSVMSLTTRIEAAEKALLEKKDLLTEVVSEEPEDDEARAEQEAQVEDLSAAIEAQQKGLDSLLRAESALATKAMETRKSAKENTEGEGYETQSRGARVTSQVKRKQGHFAGASLAVLMKSFVTRRDPADVIKQEIPPDERSELELMVKAVSAPADTGTAAWAGNLIQQRWGEFMDLIRDRSVYPTVPGARVDFGPAGQLNYPRNDGRGALAGDFVAEGAPIPVKQGIIGSVNLTPKKLAVISSFTREMARTSIPAIQSVITNQILGDTAELLDTRLTDAGARSAVRPAGYQDTTETGAANINASAGDTVANINADTLAMIQRLLGARAGNNAAWLMNPLRVISLRDIQDAASGVFVYRDELANGMFRGYPIIQSLNLPEDAVVLQAGGGIVYANQFAPMVEVSDQATLVYDDAAPDHIIDGGVATTMPVQSLYQMDGVAVKMTMGLDWRIVRIGAVQVLTSVSW